MAVPHAAMQDRSRIAQARWPVRLQSSANIPAPRPGWNRTIAWSWMPGKSPAIAGVGDRGCSVPRGSGRSGQGANCACREHGTPVHRSTVGPEPGTRSSASDLQGSRHHNQHSSGRIRSARKQPARAQPPARTRAIQATYLWTRALKIRCRRSWRLPLDQDTAILGIGSKEKTSRSPATIRRGPTSHGESAAATATAATATTVGSIEA